METTAVPEAQIYVAVAVAVVDEYVTGDTVWFYDTRGMTSENRREIETALDGLSVLYGPDWSDITSCVPDGPLPVTFSIGTASINGETAAVPVTIEDPYSSGDATITLSATHGAWTVDRIIDGGHRDKLAQDCQ